MIFDDEPTVQFCTAMPVGGWGSPPYVDHCTMETFRASDVVIRDHLFIVPRGNHSDVDQKSMSRFTETYNGLTTNKFVSVHYNVNRLGEYSQSVYDALEYRFPRNHVGALLMQVEDLMEEEQGPIWDRNIYGSQVWRERDSIWVEVTFYPDVYNGWFSHVIEQFSDSNELNMKSFEKGNKLKYQLTFK